MVGALKVQSPTKPMAAQQQHANAAQPQQPQQQEQPAAVAEPVVGPNVRGKREEYLLVRRLQSALFGGVYEAKGLTSGRDFAIKVLHKSELSKAEETSSIEFCEVPLSEIRFAELMRGDEHVMEPQEHFDDAYCYYVVFELARGGDLLEGLKEKPHGFDEQEAQFLMRQAAQGLAFLHKRKVAMQDVSLENMLLNIDEITGQYQVKICDPGQAVIFETDQMGEELQVNFRGLVGKSFRPPELHEQRPYHATKVDSWCLGWSTFYLLTAQPLFMSADPAQKDADWILFQQGNYSTLFEQKSNLCSNAGLDFIFRLMQLQPSRRMSITDALDHAWLRDPDIPPALAPPGLLPEASQTKPDEKEARAPVASKELEVSSGSPTGVPRVIRGVATGGSGSVMAAAPQAINAMPSGSTMPAMVGQTWARSSNELPTWANAQAAATAAYAGGNPRSPMLRVRSPMRAPRTSGPAQQVVSPRPALPAPDQRRGRAQQPQVPGSGRAYIASAHSPPPCVTSAASAANVAASRSSRTTRPMAPQARGASPVPGMSSVEGGRLPSPMPTGSTLAAHQGLPHAPASPTPQGARQGDGPMPPRPTFMTPRALSRPKVSSPTTKADAVQTTTTAEASDERRDWAWTVHSNGNLQDSTKRMGSDAGVMHAHGRSRASSPMTTTTMQTRLQGGQYLTTQGHQGRQVCSPARHQGAVYIARSPSPGQAVDAQGGGSCAVPARSAMRTASPASPTRTAGFSWSQAPSTYSPRTATSHQRAPSPVHAVAAPIGFAWSPEPASPRMAPTLSPAPASPITYSTKAVPVQGARSAARAA
mmetsp:Transcript_22337/g.47632  ORF Transcript_22337/g.47632 Transcript_22337/m.47632 type:complete len:817 (-) Transcript_22337:42-2492(-)